MPFNSIPQIQLVLQLFLLLSLSSNWIGRGETASISTESIRQTETITQENGFRNRRSTTMNISKICLPVAQDELMVKFDRLHTKNVLRLLPIVHNGRIITVGVSVHTARIIDDKTKFSCIKTLSVHEDPNRIPRYILLTECKNGCSSDRLRSRPTSNEENLFLVTVLSRDGTCTQTGKEAWNPKEISIPQCTIITK